MSRFHSSFLKDIIPTNAFLSMRCRDNSFPFIYRSTLLVTMNMCKYEDH